MSERRFTHKPDLNPEAVMGLAADHPAMRESRTLFPSTVVTVTETTPDRVLVSGRNNRKIGATVEKGKFKGWAIYNLSLEERATCPTDCPVRAVCYGNGMQMARRHRIGDREVFFDRIELEIAALLNDHPGLLIRLHVLGDFPDADYVAFWKDVLDEHENVACYGYTHRSPTNWGGDDIGDAIEAVKDAHPTRFRIRWSSPVARADGAIVISHVPTGPRSGDRSLVCPAQTDATACCATCALCWEQPRECIAFVKHGRQSEAVQAQAAMMAADTDGEAEIEASERLLQLEAALKDDSWVPHDWRLTKTHVAVLNVLATRRVATKEAVHVALYGTNPNGGAEPKIVDVLIHHIRKRLRGTGVKIETKWGEGYFLTDESRSFIVALKRGETPEPLKSQPSDAKDGTRFVRPITIPKNIIPAEVKTPPATRFVDPETLLIEDAYQRNLSGKSITLIKRIVGGWDWAKFKPPVCAETADGLFVIDGQHTAIAAASHPQVREIPVIVGEAGSVADRAAAFVAQNRDRVSMTPYELFHAGLSAGDNTASALASALSNAGALIPRYAPAKGRWTDGQLASPGEWQTIVKRRGPEATARLATVAIDSGMHPMPVNLVRASELLLFEPEYDDVSDGDVVAALRANPEVDALGRAAAIKDKTSRSLASAVILYRWIASNRQGKAA